MKVSKIICALAMSMALVLFGGCKKAAVGRPPVPVVSSQAVSSDVPLYIEVIGCCVASESVDIVPQVSGQIVAINFQQGQQVNAGDSLCAIDSRVYEANLSKAEAQLEIAKSRAKLSTAQLERSKALVPQNYISQQQYETYETQAAQDVANVQSAYAQFSQAKIDLEHCNIVSPINGIAGAYLVDVGNVVGAMSVNKPLAAVENVDQLYVEFNVSENDFYPLQKYFGENGGSLKVEVSPVSSGDAKGEAWIKFIDNSINRKTGSMKLRALMQNSEHKFWPGQSVHAKILLTTLSNALLVPLEAVKLGQQGRYVFVVKEDRSAELRLVEIGQVHGDMLVIEKGLNSGETVVQRGQLMLAPGQKVVELPDTQAGVFKQNLEQNKKISEKNPTTR
ncbi:MAG: efflux RND transporter periplasmic adaptor subunit [Puniceicoccales bacterium]|jgi:multidrug efflux system membrane fusion protein|nr:efflux RND transporter periplasmic adaptor subunit [Puniceicoccales bacterium]